MASESSAMLFSRMAELSLAELEVQLCGKQVSRWHNVEEDASSGIGTITSELQLRHKPCAVGPTLLN